MREPITQRPRRRRRGAQRASPGDAVVHVLPCGGVRSALRSDRGSAGAVLCRDRATPGSNRQFIAAISDHDTGWFGQSERHAEPGSGRFSKASHRRLHPEPAPGSAEPGELTRRPAGSRGSGGASARRCGVSAKPSILVTEGASTSSAGRAPPHIYRGRSPSGFGRSGRRTDLDPDQGPMRPVVD